MAQVHEYNALTAAGTGATQIIGIIFSTMIFAQFCRDGVGLRTKSDAQHLVSLGRTSVAGTII